MRIAFVLVAAALASAADYRTPAGTQTARRTEDGPGTILPGGRLLIPFGKQYTTGPGPFGLAVNGDGSRVVTSNGGPDRLSLTFLEREGAAWRTRTVALDGKAQGDPDEWRSAFMGLAFTHDSTGREILFVSEGESGQIRAIDAKTGKTAGRCDLNGDGFADSYSGDLVLDRKTARLYVVDQANFRVVAISTSDMRKIGSTRVGRLPFAIALAPDGKRLYVTNVGMFEYKPLPDADPKRPIETGLSFPAFGFPSNDARAGARRMTEHGAMNVPGLGDPNADESNSICVLDVGNGRTPKAVRFIRTGLPFGGAIVGGSSPSGIVATSDRIYVTNSTNDSVSEIDSETLRVLRTAQLRAPGLERLRGFLPIGLTWEPDHKWLLVAEAGINAVAVIDAAAMKVLGHIPAGWFPTRVEAQGGTVYVTNAKGHGIGPNATADAALPESFQAERRRGSLSRYELPEISTLEHLTAEVWRANGFAPQSDAAEIPEGLTHAVIIVKENRTFDEVFGDMPAVNGAPALARFGRSVTPNHHAIADRFAVSDNFYTDSEVSVDGHHWVVGSYPNAWTESSLMAAYAGAKSFRFPTGAPGRLGFAESNSSVHPEEQPEAGSLWHHLERNGISFRNFGEGFELAGIYEGEGVKPTGARYFTNVPMPEPLFRNTSRAYPNFNTNIPDQFRASQFIREMDQLYVKPGRPMPRLLFLHLPNDHTAKARPEDGYASEKSYLADNDLALGRILEYLSQTPEWRHMAVFVTEDDAQSGVDHVDAHRTVLLVASPFAKRGYVSHENSSFPGMLKTVLRILRLPPLNLYDATAADLSGCFLAEPDFTPYRALPVDAAIFKPETAREPRDPRPGPKMDDPREIQRQHRERE
jgi:DNA-binding beta-propeller fold protein YncE